MSLLSVGASNVTFGVGESNVTYRVGALNVTFGVGASNVTYGVGASKVTLRYRASKVIGRQKSGRRMSWGVNSQGVRRHRASYVYIRSVVKSRASGVQETNVRGVKSASTYKT